LKIAIAGRVKAGKSTLVNALIGDQIAPTDAGECTQIVTWFSDGLTYRVEAVVGDERHQLAFRRDGGALEIELGDLTARDIDRLMVDWPTPAFVAEGATDVLTGEERSYLIGQFGVFGVRLAIQAISSNRALTANELSALLIGESGIEELREVLDRSFTARRDLLIVRSVLLKLGAMFSSEPALSSLAPELERIRSGAHELTEASSLNLLRSGSVSLAERRLPELERLLGAEGLDPRSRLGLPPDSADQQLRDAALQALERQQKYAESSLGGQEARAFARVAVRTCEGMLAELGAPGRA
jgi:GTPase SAR1 family protein